MSLSTIQPASKAGCASLIRKARNGAAARGSFLIQYFPTLWRSVWESPTRNGWTAGIGLEWGFAPNWSMFAEYNYGDFATETIAFNPLVPAALIPIAMRQIAPGAAGGVFPIDTGTALS
jgi:opacity protein-like surface antigen